MTMRNNAQKVGQPKLQSPALDLVFIQRTNNKRTSKRRVAEHHGHIWDSEHGAVAAEAEATAKQSREAAEVARKRADDAQSELDASDRYEESASGTLDDPNNQRPRSVPYSKWDPYHLMTVICLFATTAILLALGGVNVAVTILASDIPAFLDAPYLAWLLACMVPATSFAVKSGASLCQLDRSKHRYAWTIFVLAGVFAFTWLVLFSLTFEGATGDINFDALGESTGSHGLMDKARTLVQILSEILVGSALFLVIDRIHARYTSTAKIERNGWREMTETAAVLRAKADVQDTLASVDAALLVQIKAARAVFVARAVSHLGQL